MKRQTSLQSPTARSRVSNPVAEIRAFFLREFLRTVVKQIPEKPEWFEDMFLVKLPPPQEQPKAQPKEKPRMQPMVMPVKRLTPLMIPAQIPKPKPAAPAQLHPRVIQPPQQPMQRSIHTPARPIVLGRVPPQTPGDSMILPKTGAKIVQFLRDPTVSGIECPGPGKNILISKYGTLMSAPIILTAEEIQAILDEISEETKIPLISGVFKALYKSLMITAVISDFVGTRFILEKRPVVPVPAAMPIRS